MRTLLKANMTDFTTSAWQNAHCRVCKERKKPKNLALRRFFKKWTGESMALRVWASRFCAS
jgi:hypothetical protein